MLSVKEGEVLSNIRNKVKVKLSTAEAGHDWWHILRVYNNAKHILLSEKVNSYVVLLAALLHDIADAKFHNGDESVGPRIATEIMKAEEIEDATIVHVVNIIKHMSYKNSLEAAQWSSPEMLVVQDADRLDAIGAIGIARAFSYGGHKGRVFYDPEIHPQVNQSKEAYKNSTAPTVNHFYEKLFLLKEQMNTTTGKELAQERHNYMIGYLEQFYKEWSGDDTIPMDFELPSR